MQFKMTGFKFLASLALITVLGPSAIDMYLASMPDMAAEPGASSASIQLTLTVFLLAMGFGQLIFGPIIDALGRRRPLLIGISCFIICSVWAAYVTSFDTLLCVRFFQGLAASLTLVVAISSVRDVATGTDAAKLFALLMTIEGLAPVLAPAAALLGALQLMLSSAATPLAGWLAGKSADHWLSFLALFGLFVVVITVVAIRRAGTDIEYVTSH